MLYLESVYKLLFFILVMPEVGNRASRLVPAKAGNHIDELDSRSKTCGNDRSMFEFMDRL